MCNQKLITPHLSSSREPESESDNLTGEQRLRFEGLSFSYSKCGTNMNTPFNTRDVSLFSLSCVTRNGIEDLPCLLRTQQARNGAYGAVRLIIIKQTGSRSLVVIQALLGQSFCQVALHSGQSLLLST